ncbi:MAG: HAD family hydrolase [Bacteroidetes bacterium]|uniref:phosphoglycolate phosphatase n=1 Tax=Candidatus Cryptobacteroides avicola TaxID=2840757 RepID=A0A940DS52_9BACT|nr:HAD family hydrolase [Candidatus Cryptobacteroides avicola]
MIKLAIFDLDGTLLNTIEDLGTACNHALKMCGYPERDMCEYNTLVGRGIYNLFMGALPQSARTEKEVMRMKTHFIPFYDEHKCDRTRPYNGIYGMLDRLNENGIRLAVASNKYQDGTEKLVRRFFGKYSFVRILGQRDGMPIKPDPMIVTEAMSAAGISDKADVIYSGDSDVDMQTGINADVRTAGVTWGFRTREELMAYRPWAIADSPDQLCRLILEA